jgi:hypothetical protein
MVVWANPSLIGVSDGVVNKSQRDLLGDRKEKTMSGQNHLMSNAYVDAYQAELRSELHRAGASRSRLEAINRLAERWLSRTGALRATRGIAAPSQTR